MKIKLLLILFVLLPVNAVAAKSKYDKYIKAAQKGDADAQYIIGTCYWDGWNGVSADKAQAASWFRKAAEQGHAKAQCELGFCYKGYGIPADEKQQFYWFRKSAEQGYAKAQNFLGDCYGYGIGVSEDFAQAAHWYEKAAEQGNQDAQYQCGKHYVRGLGVAVDYEKAKYYFEKAIEKRIGDISTPAWHNDAQQELTKIKQYLSKKPQQQQLAQNSSQQTAKPVVTQKQQPAVTQKQQPAVTQKQQPAVTSQPKSQSAVVQQSQPAPKPTVASQPQKSLTGIVDKNIPVTGQTDRNTFAVIIGNEHYKNDIASVPFAENDAKVFKEYVEKTLGVPGDQIKFITNAGLNDLRIAVRWLKQAMTVCNGQGKAIFYYAGHGIPGEADKTAYLLPTDGIGGDAETAYSLALLYKELGNMQAQRTMVFLDACFSGSTREGQMMASARGVAIKVKPTTPVGKMVVFTAAQGDETAYPYNEQQHGMFTYHLLKKMQETKGNVSLGELGDYLTNEVRRQSFVKNKKIQTPSVMPSAAIAAMWKNLKMK